MPAAGDERVPTALPYGDTVLLALVHLPLPSRGVVLFPFSRNDRDRPLTCHPPQPLLPDVPIQRRPSLCVACCRSVRRECRRGRGRSGPGHDRICPALSASPTLSLGSRRSASSSRPSLLHRRREAEEEGEEEEEEEKEEDPDGCSGGLKSSWRRDLDRWTRRGRLFPFLSTALDGFGRAWARPGLRFPSPSSLSAALARHRTAVPFEHSGLCHQGTRPLRSPRLSTLVARAIRTILQRNSLKGCGLAGRPLVTI